MSTVVHHGLHSFLDSQIMDYRTLKLKLSSPKLSFSQSLEISLQSYSIVPTDSDPKKLDKLFSNTTAQALFFEKLIDPYVHSSVRLNEKSLKMCTENLGSETGSELVKTTIFSSPECSSSDYEIKMSVKMKVQQTMRSRRQVDKSKQFPPPLTTLSGPDSLNVKAYRENGRLRLKATRSDLTGGSYFHVDRSNGRLRLTLTDVIRSSGSHCCSSKQTEQDENDE